MMEVFTGRRTGESDTDILTDWQCRIKHHNLPLRMKIIFAAAKAEEPATC